MKLSFTLPFVTALFSLTASVSAATPLTDALYSGCDSTYARYVFECPKGKKLAACSCNSKEYLASWMDCVTRSQTPKAEQVRAMGTLMSVCEMFNPNITEAKLAQIYANATDFFIDEKVLVGKKGVVFNPVKVKESTILLWIKSQRATVDELYTDKLFSGIILAYWGFVLLAGGFVNFLKKVAPRTIPKGNSGFWLFIRKNFAHPALFGQSHSVPVKAFKVLNLNVPTRAQTFVLFGYVVLSVVLHVVSHHSFAGNLTFKSKAAQLFFFIGNRGAIFAAFHIPLVILLGGRNNFLLTVTGYSFETMNVYHRWIARGMYVNLILHASCISKYLDLTGLYPAIFHKKHFVDYGLTGILCGAVILFTSGRIFREKFHEFFVLIHWVFVACFLGAVWVHVKVNGFQQAVYAAVAIWGFDRLLRIGRIVLSGVNAKAEGQMYPQNVMKYKIDYSNAYGVNPGAHVYVHFMKLTSFWQSHPFSIYRSPVPGEEKKMVLAVRKRSGITNSLANQLAKAPQGRANINILIDGPYGQRFPIANYNTMVFIAGGIGVTATYGYIDGLKRAGLSEKQRLVFVWVIRNRDDLDWFRNELDYLCRDGTIDVRIFITNQNDSRNMSSSEADKESEIDRPSSDYNAVYVKPNLDELIATFVSEADSSIGFFTCGPATMNDDARAAVGRNLDRGRGRVEYFEESFAL